MQARETKITKRLQDFNRGRGVTNRRVLGIPELALARTGDGKGLADKARSGYGCHQLDSFIDFDLAVIDRFPGK